jgi:hypothetical protein
MNALSMIRAIAIAAMATGTTLWGAEPNDSFSTATEVPAGTLSIADELTAALFPDTLLGVRNEDGDIYLTDDDGSPIGDGRASGLAEIAIDAESIQFAVSGYGDTVTNGDFEGDHYEQGAYEIFVQVYDPMGSEIGLLSETAMLEVGSVNEFAFSNAAWAGGSYDVFIDNTVGRSDVDFFTFPDLVPGAEFEARTTDEIGSGVVPYLGWFDEFGELIIADANSGDGGYPLIAGTVPSNGSLTFAVTGLGDDTFTGLHYSAGAYALTLELAESPPSGDLNRDGTVDVADYVMWHKQDGLPAEYELWRRTFGQATELSATAYSAANIPEPPAYGFLGSLVAVICLGFPAVTRWRTL